MSHTDNSIKNNYFYQLIILLIVTIFSSCKCYSVNNNEIQAPQILPLNSLQPVKPPPSYEMVISNNGNILPTYQQATIDQRNDYLTEEENSNSSEAIILNINAEQAYDTIVNDNCFCNYLKKYKKHILIKVLPYFISVIASVIIGILRLYNVIDNYTLVVLTFSMIVIVAVYGRIERHLVKKFITSTS